MLAELQQVIVKKPFRMSRRGTDSAQFLFVSSTERAIEVSEDGDSLWIEFWENADEEADDSPVKECRCNTIESALHEIENWLAPVK